VDGEERGKKEKSLSESLAEALGGGEKKGKKDGWLSGAKKALAVLIL